MDSAHERATALAKSGRFEDADPWFLNALARHPGHLPLIRDFADMVRVAAAQTADRQPQAALQQLEWLADFLSERVVHVAPDDLPVLLSMVADARAEASKSRTRQEKDTAGTASPKPESRPKLDLEELRARPPKSFDGLAAALDALDSALPSDEVDAVRQWFRVLLAVSGLVRQGNELLDAAEASIDPTDAAYLLSSVESLLREAYPHLPKLDNHRKESLRELRTRVEQLTEVTAALQEAARSAAAWKDWRRNNNGPARWKVPSTPQSQAVCQKRIDALQELASSLQSAMPTIRVGDAEAEAIALLGRIGDAMETAREAQHRLYNAWAIARIEQAYKLGCEHIGVIKDDKKKLGKVLIQHLGPIDVRLLTHEVQRSYTEVFEYLFSKLNPPKDAGESFDQEDNKLHLLKWMAHQKKKRLEDL